MVSECVARAEQLEKLNLAEQNLSRELKILEKSKKEDSLRLEFEQLSEQVRLVEERIASLNHVAAGIQANIQSEQRNPSQKSQTIKPDEEKARCIQTKIEAHLFVNLQ